MPLMVTIQPWVFITMYWSKQYDFNLVRHPTPKNEFFLILGKNKFSYSEKTINRKKGPWAGFELGTPTTEKISEYWCSKPFGYDPAWIHSLEWQPSHTPVIVFWLFGGIYLGFSACLLWFMLVFWLPISIYNLFLLGMAQLCVSKKLEKLFRNPG